MKKITLKLLTGYQTLISPILKSIFGANGACRYQITCSDYAKNVIQKEGVIKGGWKSTLRILSCQPFIKTN